MLDRTAEELNSQGYGKKWHWKKIEKYRLQPYMPKRVQAVLDRVVEEYINQDYKYKQFENMLPIGRLLPIAGYVVNGPLIFTS